MTRGRSPPPHEATHAVAEVCRVEVDEQTNVDTREVEIGEQLREMHGRERVDGFQLDEDRSFDDEVRTKGALEQQSFVGKADRRLLGEANPLKRELVRQAALVNRFEQSRSAMSMDLDTSRQNATTQIPKSSSPVPPSSQLFFFGHAEASAAAGERLRGNYGNSIVSL